MLINSSVAHAGTARRSQDVVAGAPEASADLRVGVRAVGLAEDSRRGAGEPQEASRGPVSRPTSNTRFEDLAGLSFGEARDTATTGSAYSDRSGVFISAESDGVLILPSFRDSWERS